SRRWRRLRLPPPLPAKSTLMRSGKLSLPEPLRRLFRDDVVDPHAHARFGPGEVFELVSGAPDRQYLKVRGEPPARVRVPHRGLVPGGDVRRGPAEQRVEPPQHVQVERPERLPRRLVEGRKI